MFVHQVHPRSTFQKQFRRRPLRQQKAKRTFPFSPCRGSVQRVRAEVLCSDTPFSAKFHVSRTGYCRSAEVSCSDTPFQEEKPVSRQLDTGKAVAQCSDTPFSAKSPVSRTGNCHSATIPCSNTPFQEEKPVSRQPDTGKAVARCSDTPFSAKFRVSRKGNRIPLPTHKNNRRPPKKSARIGSD